METRMRRYDRKVTSSMEIESIVKSADVMHLGFIDGDFPYVVPVCYGYETDENGNYKFYFHGAKEGHKIDLMNKNPNVCVEIETDVVPISGEDVPCKYGTLFASFIGKGKASVVTDFDEKLKALDLIMLNQTGKKFEYTERMINTLGIYKVVIEYYCAKARRK